ncbi:MAG: hypothetical protein ACI9WU_005510 [Myxococcota bacterium]|jgi:uncharacterized protein YaeQ
MAISAKIHRFELDISDVDRGVYESAEFRLARHPSETEIFAITRVIAYALEYSQGLAFGRGLAHPDDAALSEPNQMGGVQTWIDIGAPSADRIHRAMKKAERVVIYSHKPMEHVRRALSGRTIHNAEELEIVLLPSDFLGALEPLLGRTNRWSILRSDGRLYVTVGEETVETDISVERLEA